MRIMRFRAYFKWPATVPGSFRQSRSGTSAVEFAIVSPLFLLFLLGLLAYGIYFGASHSVQQIAADAARTAIAGLNETERNRLASDYIRLNAAGYPFVDPGKLTVDARDSSADGDQFVITISYDASDLPIWNLLRDLPLPAQTIHRSSTIRVGGI